jgi:hypothetical protein
MNRWHNGDAGSWSALVARVESVGANSLKGKVIVFYNNKEDNA